MFRRFLLSAVVLVPGTISFAQQSIIDPVWNVGSGPDGPVYAVLVQTNGSILIGGNFTNFNGTPARYLARLNPEGSLDTTFHPAADGVVNRLLQLDDGKVLVGGAFNRLHGANRRALARLYPSGNLDFSFDPGDAYDTNESVTTVCVCSNGMILTASSATIDYYLLSRLTRLESDGRLDTTFTRQTANYFIYALLPVADGKTLVGGGFSTIGTQTQRALLMINERGEFDPAVPPLFTGYTTIFSLARLTNGNILVGGQLDAAGASGVRILGQLTPAWAWDTGFTPLYSAESGFVRDAVVQPDGKILIAGVFYHLQGHWRRHIARLDASGAVDPCFNPTLGLGGTEGAHTLALQQDGRVIVGGAFDTSQWTGYSNLARLLPRTDCSITRAYIFKYYGSAMILGCCPPGGTNHIQISTNLLDWSTVETSFDPYFATYGSSEITNAFFRIMREP